MPISAKTVAITKPLIEGYEIKDAEDFITYAARVSNPSNQMNMKTKAKLLKYLMDHSHCSPFEQVTISLECVVPRDIGRQVLRHHSLRFQEFSQRYAESTQFEVRECRLQDPKNRQSSIECTEGPTADWWYTTQLAYIHDLKAVYEEALSRGIAKEVARAILPEGLTMSTMIITGNLRSLIHYCTLRMDAGTQKEHRQLAAAIYEALLPHFPHILKAPENAEV